MSRRRRALAVILVGVLVGSAGCNVLVGDEPLEYSSTPATIENETLEQSGYDDGGVSERIITRNFSVADRDRQVNVTNHLARYEREIDLGLFGNVRAALAVAFTSPQVTVFGENFNPIADLTTREILTRVSSAYEGITVGRQIGTRNVTSLGETRSLKRFTGTATLQGQEIDVYIEATAAFKHGDDFVVFIAVYPQDLPGEQETILTLFRNLEHDS